MCNHYSNDLRKLGRFLGELIGEQFNETKIPLRFENQLKAEYKGGVWPDVPGVVMLQKGDGYDLQVMRWGFPKKTDADGNIEKGVTWITNARYVVNERGGLYPTFADWTGPEYRCLVPATSFFEPDGRHTGGGRTPEVEFARAGGEPFFFAGFWRPWTGPRGPLKAPILDDHLLYTFLTTWPNELVKPIHKKAMPVILTWDDAEVWLNEPIEDAIKLQKPAPDGLLAILESTKGEPAPPKQASLF
jgi:putative SOS response-associated peptidase YedK